MNIYHAHPKKTTICIIKSIPKAYTYQNTHIVASNSGVHESLFIHELQHTKALSVNM